MKVLILAALVVSISAGWLDSWKDEKLQSGQPLTHTEYESGKEYVYKYESQVLTGLPTFTKSHGGIKIVGKVKFDFTSARDVVMQLTESQILSLNHEITNPSDLPPTKQLPLDHFTPLPSSQLRLIKPKVELPIKFRYENGKVTSIQVADKETNWSIDLKRSILAMLQIRLQADSTSTTPDLSYNELSEDNSTSFDFLEPALDGNCYSGISVRHVPDSTEQNMYRVLKTRDPLNCVKLNSLYKVTWPQNIAQCDCQPNLEQKQCKCLPTSTEYKNANPAYFDAKILSEYKVMSHDRTNLMIKSCAQSATYRYEFPSYPNQYLATFSNQTMKYIQVKDDQTIDVSGHSWRSINDPWKHQILKDDEEQLMMTEAQILTQAKTLINEMALLSNQPGRFEDHLTVFYQLVENLRLQNQNQLTNLFREFSIKDNYKKWKVMVDALAHCNTTVCDKFLMDKIAYGAKNPKTETFPSNQSTTIFMLWAANKVPTIPVLDKFRDTVIPALEGKQDQKMAYHHSLLCFGSMVRRYIHSEEIKKKVCVLEADRLRHQKNIENCRKYEKIIEDLLKNAQDDQEKIAVLKALTNLGSLKSLPELQKMMSKDQTNAVRVHAVYAVKNLCFQNRVKVLQTLVPLLMDVTEDSEVRMASFIFYLLSNPSTTQLHRLIEQELDLDLKTFFVLTLKNELMLKGPNTYKRVQKAKLVLSKVRAFQMSSDTGSYEMKFGLRPETDGDVINWRWLTNQTSPIPRAATFQHRNILRGIPQHNFEMGFRTEGFEAMFAKMSDRASAQSPHREISSILSPLVPKSRRYDPNEIKPTMTLYIRSDGQQVAFVHFDTETITEHMMHAIRLGQAEIPIKLFQTYVTKPEQNKKLQPHGMWQVTERVNVGVIDIDGVLIIRKPEQGQLLPNISFGSEKMFRHEKKTLLSQYVRSGFAKVGVTSAMSSRQYISQQQWNVSYSFSQKNLTFNVSNPTHEILMAELEAYTNTFIVPMRVPDVVKEKDAAFRDVVTVDHHRVTFNKEIKALRSVELKSLVEGDICVPELYTFVRDRLHLLPSVLSMKKQHIKLTIQPAVSYSSRNYTFTQSLTDIQNEIAAQPDYRPTYVPDSSSESEEKENKWSLGSLGLFKDVFSSSSSSSSEEYESALSGQYDPLKQLRLGSIRRLWQGKICSRSSRRTLSMVANLTTQYEHDRPAIHYVLSSKRPAIPSVERDEVVLNGEMTRVFNPSINQIVSQSTISWGEKSDPTKNQIKVADEHTAMYKDNVCFEQSAYGCKDQYGVFYPIWYNQTTIYESKNTDLVEKMLRAVRPNYLNSAEKVLVEPSMVKPEKQMKVNVTKIYRPYEDQVDVAFMLDGKHWNMSRVYLPVEKTLDQLLNVRPMYPLGYVRPVANFLPGHVQIDPFFSRDKCVVDNTKVMSMDYKHLLMPKSDCEVVLLGECAKEHKQMMVSLKSVVRERSVEKKTLKVILGPSKIEIEVTPSTSFSSSSIKIMVNGQQKYLDSNKQVLVEQQQKPVAIISCTDGQCQLESSKHGLYITINSQRVRVEAQEGRSRYLCGLCSSHPEIRKEEANYHESIAIFKNNRKQGEQCNIEENEDSAKRFAQQWTCKEMNKHKIMHSISQGQLKTCVTTDKLPLCSRHCEHKKLRFDNLPARCVNQEEAQRLDLFSVMEGNEMILDDERILNKMRSAKMEDIPVSVSPQCN